MAKQHYRPVRALSALLTTLLGLSIWAFWPGQDHGAQLGLDLRGGTQVILTPRTADETAVTADQLAQTVSIIRARVDGFGVAEAEVTTQGSGANARIIVSIPGETDRAVVDQLKTTAALNFRPVITMDYGSAAVANAATAAPTPSSSASSAASPASSASPTTEAVPTPTPTPSVAPELLVPPISSPDLSDEFYSRFVATDCSKPEMLSGGSLDDPTQYLVACERDGSFKYVLGPASLGGAEISDAQAGLPTTGAGGWQVDLQFTTTGAKTFADVTKELYVKNSPENQFGIVLDGVVMSAPSVNEPILGGSATISGTFTAEEAQNLAQVLKFGALPVSLEASEVQQISPTLGNDQLRAGLLAGAFGLLLTIIYLFIYYRALGLVAAASLLIAGAGLYVTVVVLGRTIGFTMTLAGVAGAIVAVGISADSFVVYFERLRDELREGKRLKVAADNGWTRARRTILAADFVTILAALVLFYLSVGSVRGFAFTLGLTTLIDIAVAFMFTHPVVVLLAKSRWFSSGGALTGVSISQPSANREELS